MEFYETQTFPLVDGRFVDGCIDAFASGSQDAYVASFETYAKEVQALQGDYSADNAIQTYAQEVAAVEKRAGYIGDELPIPKATKVMDGVYTVVGSFIWGTRENFGLNNNLSAIIFPDGVFVYNAGPNEAVAYSFHQQIKRLTDKPVKWLAVENDQGHAIWVPVIGGMWA